MSGDGQVAQAEWERVTDGTSRIRVPGGWLYSVVFENCRRDPDADPPIACAFVPIPRVDVLSALMEAKAEVLKLAQREEDEAKNGSKMGEVMAAHGRAIGLERAIDIVMDRIGRVTR